MFGNGSLMSNNVQGLEKNPLRLAPTSAGNDGGGNDLHARVAVLEAELKHLATKRDIADLKIWLLTLWLFTVFQFFGFVILIWRVWD